MFLNLRARIFKTNLVQAFIAFLGRVKYNFFYLLNLFSKRRCKQSQVLGLSLQKVGLNRVFNHHGPNVDESVVKNAEFQIY
jgi:hypothetical protein